MERENMEGLITERNEKDAASSVTIVLILSTFVAICGSFSYGCAAGFSSPAEAGILEDLGLSTAQYSGFASMLTLGSMLGAIVSGKIADFIGRRRTMLFTAIFCIIGWLALVFAKGAWWLYLGRMSMGFGAGIQTYVLPVYVIEITPKNIRGGFSVAIQLTICFGVSLMFYIGNVIAWRTLALIGTLPCLVQVLGLFFIPESPRWLAKIGQQKELQESLQCLRGENTDVSQEANEIRDSAETSHQLSSQSKFLDMFEKKYSRSLIVGIGIMVLIPFGGSSGILFYASSIFKAAGCSVSFGTKALAIIQIPFSILAVLLMDKLGRRPLLMVSLAGTCLGSFLVGLAFLLQDHQWKELTSTLTLIGIMVYFSCFAMGLTGVPWVVVAEILPLNIKASAGSLASFINMFFSWSVSYAFNFLLEWSLAGVFFIFATICGLTVLFVAKLVPETKGRSLEEIQETMTT